MRLPNEDVLSVIFTRRADQIRGMIASALDDGSTQAEIALYRSAYSGISRHGKAALAAKRAGQGLGEPDDQEFGLFFRVIAVRPGDDGFTALCIGEYEGETFEFEGVNWSWLTVWELVKERVDEDTLAAWIEDALCVLEDARSEDSVEV